MRQTALAAAALSCLAVVAARSSTGAATGSASDSLQTRLSGSWHLTFLDANAEGLDHQQVMRAGRVLRPREDIGINFQSIQCCAPDPEAELDRDDAEMRIGFLQASLSGDEKYFNAHSRDLLAPINLLNIATASSTVTMVHDTQSSTFDVTGRREKQSWAWMPVTVKSTWTAAALVQDIRGDHHAQGVAGAQPSPDGQTLTVSLAVSSPQFSPPIYRFMRTYVREPASPVTTPAESPPPPDEPAATAVGPGRALDPSGVPVHLGAAPPGTPLRGDGFDALRFGMTADDLRGVTPCYLTSVANQRLTCSNYDFSGLRMALTLSLGSDNSLIAIELEAAGLSKKEGLRATDVVLSYLEGAVGNLPAGQPLTAASIFGALTRQRAANPTSRVCSVAVTPARVFPNEYVEGTVTAMRESAFLHQTVRYTVSLSWRPQHELTPRSRVSTRLLLVRRPTRPRDVVLLHPIDVELRGAGDDLVERLVEVE